VRGIFFDPDDAESVAARLRADGYDARVVRERLAGEDDDEDHPWAVLTDAPQLALELLVDAHDGWLDLDEPDDGQAVGHTDGHADGTVAAPLPLPDQPRRHKRPPPTA